MYKVRVFGNKKSTQNLHDIQRYIGVISKIDVAVI